MAQGATTGAYNLYLDRIYALAVNQSACYMCSRGYKREQKLIRSDILGQLMVSWTRSLGLILGPNLCIIFTNLGGASEQQVGKMGRKKRAIGH